MKIVTKPVKTVNIQFREYERPAKVGKRGGRMQLKTSKTITVHDVPLEDLYQKLMDTLRQFRD